MRSKCFEMHDGKEYLHGIVVNIPDSVSDSEVKNRVETSSGDAWVEMTEDVTEDPDITIDWVNIDVFGTDEKCSNGCSGCKCHR